MFAFRASHNPNVNWTNSGAVFIGSLVAWLGVWLLLGLSGFRPFVSGNGVVEPLSLPILGIYIGSSVGELVAGFMLAFIAMIAGTTLGLKWRRRRHGRGLEFRS